MNEHPTKALNAKQQKAVRWLNEQVNSNSGHVSREDFVNACKLDDGEYAALVKYLNASGCINAIPKVSGAKFAVIVQYSDSVSGVIHQLDNPPRPDYREVLAKWFFGYWWSVPVWLLVVVLPALYGHWTFWAGLVDRFTSKD
ncbi:hypothetical protein [Roseimaritima ulvae]|uniref:hypothetical protein n=1 Tax=Roseimaritima ulvae TaxID=980254 RepID=UPI0008304F91|nr:hypothetical protein [Roseimaritima ulvae]